MTTSLISFPAFRLLDYYYFYSPEVGGEVGVGEVVVGDPAVAIDTPVGGPGVTDEELVGLIIVANCHHGVADEVGFGGLGHGDEHRWRR